MSAGAPPATYIAENAPKQTWGEKALDWLTYKGVGTYLNYVMSLAITDLFLGHTPRGDKEVQPTTSAIAAVAGDNPFGRGVRAFSDFISNADYQAKGWMDRNLVKIPQLQGDTNVKVRGTIRDNVVNIVTLTMGGHIAATMMYHMDHSRVKLAKKLDGLHDKFTGHTVSPDEAAQRQERYDALEARGSKSAGRVIAGRFAGSAVLIGSTSLLSVLDWRSLTKAKANDDIAAPEGLPKKDRTGVRAFTDKIANHTIDLVNVTAGGTYNNGKHPPERLQNVAQWATANDARKDRLTFWAEMLQFEYICTSITAKVMEVVSKFGEKKPTPVPALPKPDSRLAQSNVSSPISTGDSAEAEPAPSWRQRVPVHDTHQARAAAVATASPSLS